MFQKLLKTTTTGPGSQGGGRAKLVPIHASCLIYKGVYEFFIVKREGVKYFMT